MVELIMVDEVSNKLKWWIEARFGMFIHWGLYSIHARGEWVMYHERIPKTEYIHLAKKFHPKKFDVSEWVSLAQEVGMRYMVLTTRHHDGFCLWDSDVSDFTSVKTAANRDFVAEYVDACRQAGMRIGFYYSILDWRWPAWYYGPEKDSESWNKFCDYFHVQISELMSRYGKIDVLWLDGLPYRHSEKDWKREKLFTMIHNLQPEIINNQEDYRSSERHYPAGMKSDKPSESCDTIDDIWWGYHAGDYNLKSSTQLIRNLVRCTAGGSNYLLNIGPKANGIIPKSQSSRLKAIGKWIKLNGESIYGAGYAPFYQPHIGSVTSKDNKVYVHVMFWPGKEMCLTGIKNKVLQAYLLSTKENLLLKQTQDRLFVYGLPPKPLDPIDTVVVLELDGKPTTTPFWK
jgi:alpha-L-fucosidase